MTTTGTLAFPDRRSAILWAKATVASADVVYVDTETTGVKPTDDLADVAVLANDGAILFEELLRPSRRMPADTAAFTGLTNTLLAQAPDLREVYDGLRSVLAGKTVVAYNVEFDRGMLAGAARRRGLPELEVAGWGCAMEAYAAFNGEASWHRPGFRWMSLEKATARLGIPQPTHRARADAEACRRVVHALAAMEPGP